MNQVEPCCSWNRYLWKCILTILVGLCWKLSLFWCENQGSKWMVFFYRMIIRKMLFLFKNRLWFEDSAYMIWKILILNKETIRYKENNQKCTWQFRVASTLVSFVQVVNVSSENQNKYNFTVLSWNWAYFIYNYNTIIFIIWFNLNI